MNDDEKAEHALLALKGKLEYKRLAVNTDLSVSSLASAYAAARRDGHTPNVVFVPHESVLLAGDIRRLVKDTPGLSALAFIESGLLSWGEWVLARASPVDSVLLSGSPGA